MTPGHVLVTGGAGYIGSHTCLALLQAGWRVTVADNLSTGSREALRRVEQLTGLPLALAQGDGAELRTPLGITIAGGLILSQLLTLYTTPVVYLLLDQWQRKMSGKVHQLPKQQT